MHPHQILLGAQAASSVLPVVDHYSGVEPRMRKSLQLQAEMAQEFGACVFDVTLDCEDGAPVGAETQHADLVCALVQETMQAWQVGVAAGKTAPKPRVAVRLHAVDHPAFEADVEQIVTRVGAHLCHLMIPKLESLADVQRAVTLVDRSGGAALPLHGLIESPAALHRAFEIAAHERIQSLSFGLMDFVSSHAGAIPASAMGLPGQFSHPLVLRAKLDLASACHAHGKVPSHCVVTEFSDTQAVQLAARRAAEELGYTRMWSIHPAQIRPILEALSPSASEIEQAADIIAAAALADWGPIRHRHQLHDRASYRYFWQVLTRAHATGRPLPEAVRAYFQN